MNEDMFCKAVMCDGIRSVLEEMTAKHVKGRPQDTWASIVTKDRCNAQLELQYQRDMKIALAESLADSIEAQQRPGPVQCTTQATGPGHDRLL